MSDQKKVLALSQKVLSRDLGMALAWAIRCEFGKSWYNGTIVRSKEYIALGNGLEESFFKELLNYGLQGDEKAPLNFSALVILSYGTLDMWGWRLTNLDRMSKRIGEAWWGNARSCSNISQIKDIIGDKILSLLQRNSSPTSNLVNACEGFAQYFVENASIPTKVSIEANKITIEFTENPFEVENFNLYVLTGVVEQFIRWLFENGTPYFEGINLPVFDTASAKKITIHI